MAHEAGEFACLGARVSPFELSGGKTGHRRRLCASAATFSVLSSTRSLLKRHHRRETASRPPVTVGNGSAYLDTLNTLGAFHLWHLRRVRVSKASGSTHQCSLCRRACMQIFYGHIQQCTTDRNGRKTNRHMCACESNWIQFAATRLTQAN